ncbi:MULTISPECIES: LysR family transcriptional regulator [unclassified Meridianimarinicoccus]|uniref:LysR family transcriptional regulator n=1 Tax=unclassified Meridianimarinicoccus TaxID=2923344 RepID=UPI001866B1AA|nr:LysR family transcriptional regulator [Fluviibacterium sp. MJW13]
MNIKLEMLRTFCVVAEKGTLSGAAKALGRTPSAISMVLTQLEEHVGAPLFETDRKSRLTPLGQLVLEESRRATDVFDRSIKAIGRHAVSSVGIVRIAAVPSATVALLPKVIEMFRETHPDVRIEISDVDSAAVRRRVQRDEADIGIVSARPDDTVEGEPILCDDLGIVCAEGGPVHKAHLAAKGHSDWSLLTHEPLIANPLCNLVDDPLIPLLLAGSTLEARNTTAILSFVRRGLGASILPYDAVRNQPDGVEFFVPSTRVNSRELRKIKQDKDRTSAPITVFWALLKEYPRPP